MLFGEFGIGYGEEARFYGVFGGRIAEAEDGLAVGGSFRSVATDTRRQKREQDDQEKK
jgi:hypothetical protein